MHALINIFFEADMFNKFKDVNDAKFKGSLTNDIVGLLSLYEATHLRVHGEDILEEALNFTTTHLESAAHSLSPGPLLQQVKHALYQPFWKGNPRLEARQYLSIYRENNSHNETLLTFAKLDFNLLQKVHQKELSEITRWWKELDFVNKLPFARDKVVESYLWALGCYYEPEYSFARMIFGKVTAIMVVIDDIYDVYGTFGELELFTEAVERWDISAMVHLPEQYMKVCYQALLDLYAEIEEKLGNEGNSYRIHYAREAPLILTAQPLILTAAFFQSTAIPNQPFTLATTSLVGMGSVVTKDSLDWVFSDPQIVKAASLIGRLVDDMKSHKKRGHVASSVECYMKEHEATEEQAIIELSKQVNNAWKDVNETCHRPTIFPMQIILRIVNLARMIEVLYKHDDGFTHAGIFLKDVVVSLLVESVPL
ncbi:hypothetical protein DVH24_004324 [Malus domestica]|uniref:Terpene synthase metal-binding domain-containing protein n=1 Tax=Malus domestica TaxID=3750 RepID=A0A498KDT7_MALDO|nr:hypothetical protein DVH24_004324 [Malus domestica]